MPVRNAPTHGLRSREQSGQPPGTHGWCGQTAVSLSLGLKKNSFCRLLELQERLCTVAYMLCILPGTGICASLGGNENGLSIVSYMCKVSVITLPLGKAHNHTRHNGAVF